MSEGSEVLFSSDAVVRDSFEQVRSRLRGSDARHGRECQSIIWVAKEGRNVQSH